MNISLDKVLKPLHIGATSSETTISGLRVVICLTGASKEWHPIKRLRKKRKDKEVAIQVSSFPQGPLPQAGLFCPLKYSKASQTQAKLTFTSSRSASATW